MDARENILIIRLKSIGDVLFTLPAVHALRRNFPDARIHFMTSKENAPLLRGFSGIDAVIPVDRKIYSSGKYFSACASTARLLRDLRRPKFSRTIDFQGYGETAFLSWWSGAPERWGRVYQPVRGCAYTHGIPSDITVHPVESSLMLLRECGLNTGPVCNEFVLPYDALTAAQQFFTDHRLEAGKPTLFIQPFTSNLQKNWPMENFLKLATHWSAQGYQVIFGGGPADRAALEPAISAGFCVSAGVPLLVTGALMKLSTLIVGGDTGLLHLAVAMGRRVVMLMRSNLRGKTFPFQHPEWVVSAAPGQPISSVDISTVIEATTQAKGSQQNDPMTFLPVFKKSNPLLLKL
jgi:ADP-heptose:LPS heptosyltransferase